MRRLSAFLNLSLDGYVADARGETTFAHKPPTDLEWYQFVANNASNGGAVLLGRKTYDIMAGWWPTPMAAQAMPEVAARMNAMPKYVASRTLTEAAWSNTTVLAGDLVDAVRTLKRTPGPDVATLGSGSVVTQLVDAGLVDTLQVVVNPVVLGGGTSLLAGLSSPTALRLTESRVFGNGAVVLWYAPA